MAKKNQPSQRPKQPANRPAAQNPTPTPAAPKAATGTPKAAPAPRRTENRSNVFSTGSRELLFGRRNFMLFGLALLLLFVGLALMAGGAQPDPNVWKDEYPYSFTRITLAPILMVASFVVAIWGIFAKDKSGKVLVEDSPNP
jgi:hypothetical protein